MLTVAVGESYTRSDWQCRWTMVEAFGGSLLQPINLSAELDVLYIPELDQSSIYDAVKRRLLHIHIMEGSPFYYGHTLRDTYELPLTPLYSSSP